ncbi:MAG: glutaredoxin family protein [Firmicutes bacterium]|nr:glutaredoxin family protein [Bacillota bacterium]
MNLIKKVKELTGHKNIVYSSAVCSDCQKAEEFFEKNDIDIEVKQIENHEYRKELEEKHGRVLVPTIILGKEKFIGFQTNQDKIKKKLRLS